MVVTSLHVCLGSWLANYFLCTVYKYTLFAKAMVSQSKRDHSYFLDKVCVGIIYLMWQFNSRASWGNPTCGIQYFAHADQNTRCTMINLCSRRQMRKLQLPGIEPRPKGWESISLTSNEVMDICDEKDEYELSFIE